MRQIRQEALSSLGGLFEGQFVVGNLALLELVPMRHRMNVPVIRSPRLDEIPQGLGKFGKWATGLTAVLANQAGIRDIPSQQRQERCPTTGSGGVSDRHVDQSLKPYLPLVGQLRSQPVRTHQRVGHTPGLAMELAQGLCQPPGQTQVVKCTECPAIFPPQAIQRRFFLRF